MAISEGVKISSLKELATLAGVSTAAASNALSGKGRMSKETRTRIQLLAESVGYRPNSFAASLRTGLFKNIGFVMTPDPDPESEKRWAAYSSHLLYELVFEASKHGYTVSIITANMPELLAQLNIDFLYYFDPYPDEVLIDEANRLNIPVLSNDKFGDDRLSINLDSGFEAMTHAALDLLKKQGSIKPGLLTELPELPSDAIGEDAYLSWCTKNSVEPRIARGDWGRTNLHEKVAELVATGCDSIYSYYEEAEVVLASLRSLGIRVPEDMLLVAATSDVNETDELGVTSTVYHPDAAAAAAMPRMIARSNSLDQGLETLQLPWELVLRHSTQRN